MMSMGEARRLPGVVLGGELNVGDEVTDLAHDQRWMVIEAPRDYYGSLCIALANRQGGVLHYSVTTPFRRAT